MMYRVLILSLITLSTLTQAMDPQVKISLQTAITKHDSQQVQTLLKPYEKPNKELAHTLSDLKEIHDMAAHEKQKSRTKVNTLAQSGTLGRLGYSFMDGKSALGLGKSTGSLILAAVTAYKMYQQYQKNGFTPDLISPQQLAIFAGLFGYGMKGLHNGVQNKKLLRKNTDLVAIHAMIAQALQNIQDSQEPTIINTVVSRVEERMGETISDLIDTIADKIVPGHHSHSRPASPQPAPTVHNTASPKPAEKVEHPHHNTLQVEHTAAPKPPKTMSPRKEHKRTKSVAVPHGTHK